MTKKIAFSFFTFCTFTTIHLSGKEVADTAVVLNDISVTAIKQGINLRNQAVSVSVIDRRSAERGHIQSAKSASEIVPNVLIPDYGSRITSTIYVRGLGSRIDQSVMGLNIDNVPILNKNNYDFDLPDISRIEMLRGPQSVLFGRNTMGGVMNIYTLSPLSYQGIRLMAQYSSGNTYQISGGYYTRLKPTLGISVSAQYGSSDGFFTNEYNGKKCDWEQQGNGRIKIEYDNKEGFSLANVATLSVVRQGGYPYKFVDTGKISYNDTCFYRRTSISDGLTLRFDKDQYSISSISSLQYSDDNMTLDQDFLPDDYFTLTQTNKEYSFTEDIVMRSKDNKLYEWLFGAFAFYRHTDINAPVTFHDTGISELIEAKRNDANPDYPISWDTRQFLLGSQFTMPNWGTAIYHQSQLKYGHWTFTASVRGNFERTGLNFHSFCSTGYSISHLLTNGGSELFRHDDVNINDKGSFKKSFFHILPKLSVSYSLPTIHNSSVYALVAKGYKSGGYNTQMFSDVLQQRIMGMMGIGQNYNVDKIVGYKPEKAWTYEVGSHLELFDNRLTADISAFYINCTDQQLTTFPDGTTTGRIMTNAGKSRSMGAELTIQANILPNFNATASYGFTDAKFVEYDNGKQNFADKFLPYAPHNTIYAELSYDMPLNSEIFRSISFDINTKMIGDIYWDEANMQKQPLYALLGAQMRLNGRHYSLSLWGKNLTDTNYGTFYFVSISHDFIQQGRPRQLGATFRYFF